MAVTASKEGVTIIEVDKQGQILKSTSGYGQGWRTVAAKDCGSPEWLTELVLTPDNKSLESVIGQVASGKTFKGETTSGTSTTSCLGAVYRLASGATAPTPSEGDYEYYVMAQGIWIDKKTGQPVVKKTADSRYRASSFIISKSPIDQIASLKDQWNTLKQETAEHVKNFPAK